MSIDEPLVSVTIPAYNEEKVIERAVRSAIGQTYKNIEVIVLDDGSTDKTQAVVRRLQNDDKRIHYYYQENSGLSAARNRLFDLSKGEYIAFLDADDEWLPHKLKLQLPLFKDNPKVGLVFSKIISIHEDGRRVYEVRDRLPSRGKVFYDYLLSLNFIVLCSVVVKRDILKEYMPFKTFYSIAGDWEIFLRLSRDYEFEYLDKAVGFYYIRKISLTRQNVLREAEEGLSILEYWAKNDQRLSLKYKKRFLRAKAKFNLYIHNFYKEKNNYKNALKQLIKCIYTDPTWLSPYLRVIKLLCVIIRKRIIDALAYNISKYKP